MKRLAVSLLLLHALWVMPSVCAGAEPETGPVLRHWQVGLQSVNTWRTQFDVFGTPDIPTGAVTEHGNGGGFVFGYRFDERFLLGLQLAAAVHDIADTSETINDFEVLITGTVLFRERDTLQPFLRGGFGAGGMILDLNSSSGNVFSFGTSAIAGGGVQFRLSSRFSLELEAVATFNNYLEVHNESDDPRWTDDSWQVRQSSQGWRVGSGIFFWF